MQNLKGEDIIDDTCFIIKSHSPWIMPFAPPFNVNKMIIIVRNPCESNLSWLHLSSMANHSTKMPFNVETEYPNFWQWWTKDCMSHMKEFFYNVYMKDAKKRECPMLFVRFEDLVMDPAPVLRQMMAFILNLKDITGTNAERRLNEVLAMGSSATVTYSLKDSTRKCNQNITRYSEEQLNWVKSEFKEMLHFFGYAKIPQDPTNVTGFYDFDG